MLLQITPGERFVLQWLAEGKDSSALARGFGITEAEARAQLTALLEKMGAKTPVDAVAMASRRGLLADR